jgi:molecular chaperone Hsp33
LLRFLVGDEITVHQTLEPVFYCNCSRERFERALITLGRSELRGMIDEDGQAELHCHYCNDKFLFEAEELEKLVRLTDRE